MSPTGIGEAFPCYASFNFCQLLRNTELCFVVLNTERELGNVAAISLQYLIIVTPYNNSRLNFEWNSLKQLTVEEGGAVQQRNKVTLRL